MRALPELPVTEVLPELRHALANRGAAVLEAPPGAGKSTIVPIALLDEPWLGDQTILMLEPRRLAARGVAARMAQSLNERPGETIGHRVRFESNVSARTRIEVVTEGILTRRIQNDPELRGVGLVIFDEFHERSIHADLALALCLESRGALREDLRLLIMSATLEGVAERAAGLIGGGSSSAPVISSAGKLHPLTVDFVGTPTLLHANDRRPGTVAAAVRPVIERALAEHDGDVLVFLPGAPEIRRLHDELVGTLTNAHDMAVAPLYGNLDLREQDAAIRPDPRGRRKIVLATPIAETSLTIEGIRIVIDSGLRRTPRYDPGSGLSQLVTVPISRASAEQRAGRCARLGPGRAYRLWSQHDHDRLAAHDAPEILESDLAGLVLELAAWGVSEPDALPFLDAPPRSALTHARDLLVELGALDGAYVVTESGRKMERMPLHPRLAAMLVAAPSDLACDIAALLSERDLLRRSGPELPPSDLTLRLDALHGTARANTDAGALANVRRVAQQLRKMCRSSSESSPENAGDANAGALLALAYPDRIARRRSGSRDRYLLANGRGARLNVPESQRETPEWIVAAHLDGSGADARIILHAEVSAGEIETRFAARISEGDVVAWEDDRLVRAHERRLGAIRLARRDAGDAALQPAEIEAALLEGVRGMMQTSGGDVVPPWNEWDASGDARRFQARAEFLRKHADDLDLPDVSDVYLAARPDEWLLPHLSGVTKRADFAKLDFAMILQSRFTYEQLRAIDDGAPERFETPAGTRVALEYANDECVLAAKLQELFGITETPRVAFGRVPLTVHLLSPARRPIQVTRDLGNFWKNTYAEVKKELMGRYPKHPWPDDPLSATATRFTKKRAGANAKNQKK